MTDLSKPKATDKDSDKKSPNMAPRMVEVTLKKPHEHGGKKHPAGAVIPVTPVEKKFLAERGKI